MRDKVYDSVEVDSNKLFSVADYKKYNNDKIFDDLLVTVRTVRVQPYDSALSPCERPLSRDITTVVVGTHRDRNDIIQ